MIFLLLLFLTGFDLNPPEVEDLVRAGLEYAYIEQFDSAKIYFDEIVESHPKNPTGYFLNAALLQLKMMDESRFSEEDEYFHLLRRTEKLAKEILDEEDNLWARFFLANSYSYRAVYEGFKNNYFETFKYGVKGGRMMQDLIKRDSTFYDAYLAVGTFEYFWARASRYLPILKLMGGNVEEAIRKIHIAAEKSIYSGPTARNSLVFIYSEEGRYDEAKHIIDGLLSEYPRSRTFLWNKAYIEYKHKNYQLAADIYVELYSQYDAHNDKNYANLAQCKLFIGKCFYELKEKDKAKKALKDVIGFKQYSETYPQIKGYCREAYSLLNRLL